MSKLRLRFHGRLDAAEGRSNRDLQIDTQDGRTVAIVDPGRHRLAKS